MVPNNYYTSIIDRLQAKIYAFMDDIRRGTNIFEGRRSIEEQLSEEYHARFLIELIQNADDACGKDGQILIVIRQEPSPRVVVCNTGKGFIRKNFESLCTLGLTDKNPEEAIGNKGLGFRSVLEVCKSPSIYSSDINRSENTQPNFDGYCFCFDPDELVNSLLATSEGFFTGDGVPQMVISGEPFQLLENTQPEIVDSLKNSLNNPKIFERSCKWLPVYEMPIPIKVSDPLLPWAAKLGSATAVSIEIKPGTETVFRKALAELQPYTFLFLRNAKNISVYMENSEDAEPRKIFEFVRAIPFSENAGEVRKGQIEVVYHDRQAWADICGKEPESLGGESQTWWFYKKPMHRKDFEDALATLPERWHQIRQVDVEVAVPIGGNGEGRFSIYLPTLVKTGTGAWINAPFYGNIDRKSIVWDRKWNSTILSHAVTCVKDMVRVLRNSRDIESSQAILRLLGIIDQEQALSKEQISSESIQHIVKEEDWVLSEPNSRGELEYKKISQITLPSDLTWRVDPVKQVLDIECREKIPLLKPHPELPNQEVIENTAKIYESETKTPTNEELARLAEIAIRSSTKDKQDSAWWNSLYRWLGHLDIPYEALVGKKLIWTQTGIYKVEKKSRIFSPPRRPVASDDEDTPMIKKFQDMLTESLPAALKNRVSFLHPEIDLGDKQIRSFLIREYRGEQVVIKYETKQVAEFILNRVCRDLYKERMSKKRKRDAAEIFAWTFILWKQMRGEGQSVEWNHLLVPTDIGYRPGNETYAGKAWTDDEGADLEKVFQNAEPKKPFVVHPNTLIQMLPKAYQELISSYNLKSDLKQFILEALGVWTAPRLNILKAARPGGFLPELCPSGSYYSLKTQALRDVPDKYKLPISKKTWESYLQRLENESEHRPFQMSAKYVLNQISYIEETPNPVTDAQALARCMGRGWTKYYRKHMTANIRRDPREGGEPNQWSVTGFVVEQLSQTEWIPSKVWATKIIEEREASDEFSDIVKPGKAIKINKDLLGPGSTLKYSLLPHIDPAVEECISEELCGKVGIVVYSPQKAQNPFQIMGLLCQAQKHLPTEREHFLLSLWQDLFDSAVSQSYYGTVPINAPDSALAYEIQKDGGKRFCWLEPVADDDSEKYTAWVNDNDDCLSLLPPGTLIACARKTRAPWKDRVTILKHILKNADVRRLSKLKIIPEYQEVDGWREPRLINDVFPWLVQPALAVLAFGRGTQPMSVSNPEGDFQKKLLTRIQNTRARYVRKLLIKIEGLNVEPKSRTIFYSSSENLLYLDIGEELKLRDLALPLSLLFDREDYLRPAELWLRNIEETTSVSVLREDVPPDIAIDELHIEAANLQELFQVIGGQTQQIIRSVAPALFFLCKSGELPLSEEEFNSIISKIADSGKPYELAEQMMTNMLNKCGISEASTKANSLRQLAEQMRDAAEISRKAYELFRIDLKNWNSAAREIGARTQLVRNDQATETFNKVKQETRWAACGFLQKNLEGSRKEEFKEKWLSYDHLKPSDSIHDTWTQDSSIIESPIIDWFNTQAADLMDKPDLLNDDKFLESIKDKYDSLHKDPDMILDSNINSIKDQWKRLRILLISLALRGVKSDTIISGLKGIEDNAPGNWVKDDEKLSSSLSVGLISNEELFNLLCEWIATQSVVVKKPFKGTKAKTLDDFIKANKITPDEELKAEERLGKEPKSVPKQTIARNSLEIPDKDQSLDELKKKLDQILYESDKKMLNKLTLDVSIDLTANLGEKPQPRMKAKKRKRKIFTGKGKDTEFIGYVAEYLIFQALKNCYPHIGLSEWMSGNKEKFFPGSKGDDSLGYDFCIPVDGRKIMIEVKSHTGDQSYFELGSTQLDAAQRVLETGETYQIWVIRNMEGDLEIDHLPNPMVRENRKHFRFEVGRVYYQTEKGFDH
jgi:hypothetical protein